MYFSKQRKSQNRETYKGIGKTEDLKGSPGMIGDQQDQGTTSVDWNREPESSEKEASKGEMKPPQFIGTITGLCQKCWSGWKILLEKQENEKIR